MACKDDNNTCVFFQCEQKRPNATSLQADFRSRLENETSSFTYKLAFQLLITAIVSHERHKMVMPLSAQLTPLLSHPIYPSLPTVGACHCWQTYYLQYDRALLPQNGGFDFPQWHLITVAVLQLAFPRSESRPEPEAKSCTFSVFVRSLVSFIQLTDGIKTDQNK